jgi:ABC-type phosphate transport system substrate-binding protein
MGRAIRTALSVFWFLGVFLSTTGSFADPLNGHVILAGSSTIQPVAEAFGLAFEKQYPVVRIDVHGGGSSVGIIAPQTGLADVGMVSRPLRHNETPHLTSTTFALDGIAPLPMRATQSMISVHSRSSTSTPGLSPIGTG